MYVQRIIVPQNVHSRMMTVVVIVVVAPLHPLDSLSFPSSIHLHQVMSPELRAGSCHRNSPSRPQSFIVDSSRR